MAPSRCSGRASPGRSAAAVSSASRSSRGQSSRRRLAAGGGGACWLLALMVGGTLLSWGGGVGVSAEPLHHSRTYKDEYGLEPPRRVFGVKTSEQGLEYLVKYGWVNCTLNFNSYQNVYSDMLLKSDPNARAHEAISAKPLCTDDEESKGYIAMQQYYKLPETGTLDDNTLRLMNSKRCGNRDSGAGENKQADAPAPKTKTPSRVKRAALVEIARRKAEEEERERRAREWSSAHGSVILGKLLSQTKVSPASSIIRRQQILDQYTQEFRTQDFLRTRGRRTKTSAADIVFRAAREKAGEEADLYERAVKSRSKRSAMITLNGAQPEVFKKGRDECVTWRIPDICYSRRIPAEDQRGIVRLAFRMWSEVIPLCFSEQRVGAIRDVDIQICFAKDTHLNCDIPFDGNGGELAHSWKLGNIHFDDAENYKPQGNGGINLLKVAVHEIGHVLGLNHTQRNYSVMYSIYIGVPIQSDFELGWEDRKEVQKYYGVCKGRFDTVFDWIRLSVTQGLIYNTYFFRHSRYWMYENRFNRTRYGDPLNIANEWKGVPSNVDGYTQVILWDHEGYRWNIHTYFFKGDKFYVYDSSSDSVQRGSLITDYFGPKNESSESIPNNLDSIFFDIRTKQLQFFKGPWVYIYDPAAGANRCCEHKVKFVDLYPTLVGEVLNGEVDAVYFSHTQRKQYFFRGEDVWINDGNKTSHRLSFVKEWYRIWFDICDVGFLKTILKTIQKPPGDDPTPGIAGPVAQTSPTQPPPAPH